MGENHVLADTLFECLADDGGKRIKPVGQSC